MRTSFTLQNIRHRLLKEKQAVTATGYQIYREHRPALVALFLYFVMSFGVCLLLGKHRSISIDMMYLKLYILVFKVSALYVALAFAIAFIRIVRRRQGVITPFANVIRHYLQLRYFFSFFLFIACYFLYITSVTNFKGLIPSIHPFSWDPFFYRLDLVLGGGVTPWVHLQHWVGSNQLLQISDRFYLLWFVVTPALVLHQFFSANKRLANHYILSFVLVWCLLGHVAAVYFSSVGPCFFHWLMPAPADYLEMMHTLGLASEKVHVTFHLLQDRMAPYRTEYNHISAFPSMHVAGATLVMCYMSHQRRVYFAIATLYALMVIFCSVYLGWHYLSDGLFSFMATWLIWISMGWAMKRYPCLQ